MQHNCKTKIVRTYLERVTGQRHGLQPRRHDVDDLPRVWGVIRQWPPRPREQPQHKQSCEPARRGAIAITAALTVFTPRLGSCIDALFASSRDQCLMFLSPSLQGFV